MIRYFPVIIALAFGPASASAAPTAADHARSGVAEFRAAFQEWDAARFAKAAEQFQAAAAAEADAASHHYWLGVAEFHRMLQLQSANQPNDQKLARDASEAALQKAVAIDPAHAESHALLGTLLGMKIRSSLLGGMKWGPAVLRHQQAALQNGGTNPRVRYLLGAARFRNADDPAEVREALDDLLLAVRLFDREAAQPATPLVPRWGASSCLTFAGLAHEKLGQHAQAAASFRRALALHAKDSVAAAGLKRTASR